MRGATLLVTMLAACAARPGAGVGRAPSAQDPPARGAGAQEPEHIDQRLPPRPGTGPRPFRAPVLAVSAAVGFGDVAVRMQGLRLDDRADARLLRLGIDAGTRAGLQVTAVDSETELFPAELVSDGIAAAPADASLLAVDAFPHLRLATVDGRFRVPLRVGVFADWRHLDHELAGVDRQWLGLGPRLVAEPTWRLLGGEDQALDLVGHAGGDVGAAWFRERYPTGDDRDTTFRWGGELGASLRYLHGRAHVELGYRVQHTLFGPTQGDLLGDQHRTEQQMQHVFLGVGVTW